MTSKLLNCPFCNAAMSIESNRDWHRIVGEHDERCLFMDRETVTVPATDEQLALAVRDWNRRATQPAAGEPIQVEAVAITREDEDGLYLDWVLEGGISALEAPGVVLLVAHGTVTDDQGSGEVYLAPPAAAHGDEAVRKDATESAIQRACRELPEGWSLQIELERGAGDVTLFNAWDIVVDFGQDFESSISEQVEAAIDAAMRAQGDGGQA